MPASESELSTPTLTSTGGARGGGCAVAATAGGAGPRAVAALAVDGAGPLAAGAAVGGVEAGALGLADGVPVPPQATSQSRASAAAASRALAMIGHRCVIGRISSGARCRAGGPPVAWERPGRRYHGSRRGPSPASRARIAPRDGRPAVAGRGTSGT